jgi:hypothetical protein
MPTEFKQIRSPHLRGVRRLPPWMIAHFWGEDPPRSIRRRLTAEIYQVAAEIRAAKWRRAGELGDWRSPQ